MKSNITSITIVLLYCWAPGALICAYLLSRKMAQSGGGRFFITVGLGAVLFLAGGVALVAGCGALASPW